MMDSDSQPRLRRSRHDPSKHYDAGRKDLELSQVLDVLQCYVDYGGGINCSVCGKLYKSRVCFIKHLWEHTVYWDQFAGDKNHMRVLSIQAALILYGTCQQPIPSIPVDSLLVTSPHSTEHVGDLKTTSTSSVDMRMSASCETDVSAKASLSGSVKNLPNSHSGISSDCFLPSVDRMLPTTPPKKSNQLSLPSAPTKKRCHQHIASTPLKRHVPSVLKSSHKRRAPPRLDFGAPIMKMVISPVSSPVPADDFQPLVRPSPLMLSGSTPFLQTPVKQGIPCTQPKTPRKQNKKRSMESLSLSTSSCTNRRVSRFCVPTSNVSSNDHCWKEADSCACKRKRSE